MSKHRTRLKKYRRDGAPSVTQTPEGNTEGNKARQPLKGVTRKDAEVTIRDGETATDAAGRAGRRRCIAGGAPVDTSTTGTTARYVANRSASRRDAEIAAERLSVNVDVGNTTFDEWIKEVYLALLNRLEYDKKSRKVVTVGTSR
ncbi:hypothetical protein [Burkholderia multivorans]|uniref:hypothetical protein n=1 Tax=Burkholderia multivorans TaxID=87883 RepID=UPI0011B22C19|nr:hypothetical protein [Burkholderia multivorans]